jgi:hypothetical protein
LNTGVIRVKLFKSFWTEEALEMHKQNLKAILSLVAFMMALFTAGFFSGGLSAAYAGTDQDLGFTQQSGTTGGELSRYIDISSPWSGGYLYEDMTVTGSASISESFVMYNLKPGSNVDYWEKAFKNFDIGFDIPPASGFPNKPAAAVAGASVVVEKEDAPDIRNGFRWFDLF